MTLSALLAELRTLVEKKGAISTSSYYSSETVTSRTPKGRAYRTRVSLGAQHDGQRRELEVTKEKPVGASKPKIKLKVR